MGSILEVKETDTTLRDYRDYSISHYDGVLLPQNVHSNGIRKMLKLLTQIEFEETQGSRFRLTAYVATKPSELTIKGKTIRLQLGSIVIVNTDYQPKSSPNFLVFSTFRPQYLFCNTIRRMAYLKQIDLSSVRSANRWEQNVESRIRIDSEIGSGCYGSVYYGYCSGSGSSSSTSSTDSTTSSIKIAVKYSKLSIDATNTENHFSWNEVKILNLLKPIVEKGYSQNVAYLIDAFTSSNGKFGNIKFSESDQKEKCLVMLFECASGNLKKFLANSHTEEELDVCLFQIMFGLHTIQTVAQIQHYDLKAANILCFELDRGGYWEYSVCGKTYFVPNLGFLFVIADLGLARPLSPKHIMLRRGSDTLFRIGHRYAIVDGRSLIPLSAKKQTALNGKISDANVIKWKSGERSLGGLSCCALNGKAVNIDFEFTPEQKKIIARKNIFLHPELCPPFEFFNDIQDVIRMFIGGKRMSQEGNHVEFSLNDAFIKKLAPYRCDDTGVYPTESWCVLASHFILSFFEKEFQEPKEHILQRFEL